MTINLMRFIIIFLAVQETKPDKMQLAFSMAESQSRCRFDSCQRQPSFNDDDPRPCNQPRQRIVPFSTTTERILIRLQDGCRLSIWDGEKADFVLVTRQCAFDVFRQRDSLPALSSLALIVRRIRNVKLISVDKSPCATYMAEYRRLIDAVSHDGYLSLSLSLSLSSDA